jgi:hypothetical protein
MAVPQAETAVQITKVWRSMCGCGLVIRTPAASASRRRRRVAAWRSIRMAARALHDQPQAKMLIHGTAGRRRPVMAGYAVLRLRGHDRTAAAALALRYRNGAELVPAHVRSAGRWLAAAAR